MLTVINWVAAIMWIAIALAGTHAKVRDNEFTTTDFWAVVIFLVTGAAFIANALN